MIIMNKEVGQKLLPIITHVNKELVDESEAAFTALL